MHNTSRMRHTISLAAFLAIIWLLLSGYFHNPLLLGLGAVSVLLVLVIVVRMDVIDQEGHPSHLTLQAISYWPWLVKEIVVSNLDVARRIVSPSMPISPTLVRIEAAQHGDLGNVVYGNSITLTPGTVTIDIDDNGLLVHALTAEGAQALQAGDMRRRVNKMVSED